MWPKRAATPTTISALRACAQPSDSGMDGIYRQYALLLLRRYCRLSVDLGRLPSVLGREFFRAKVTSYKMHTFEEAVVFVHDMERCIESLSEDEKRLVAGLVFMEYSQSEFARLLGISRGTVVRRYNEMLDRLTQKFLDNGLIAETELRRARYRKSNVTPIHDAAGAAEKKADVTVIVSAKKSCGSEDCQASEAKRVAVADTKQRG